MSRFTENLTTRKRTRLLTHQTLQLYRNWDIRLHRPEAEHRAFVTKNEPVSKEAVIVSKTGEAIFSGAGVGTSWLKK